MKDNKLKLDFLKRILTDTTYNEDIRNDFFLTKDFPTEEVMEAVVNSEIDVQSLEGTFWPQRAHTMIGLKRLNNIHNSLDYVRENAIEGDIIETGVWRGGCCIFIKMYLKLYNLDKKIFVADSFRGLPEPTDVNDFGSDLHTYSALSISEEEVRGNFELYGALDNNVIFINGWFSDTLRDNDNIGKLCILRFDGDMYSSTMDVLNPLYDKVSDSGIIIIDDYCLPNCVKAVTEFRQKNNITDEIRVVDTCGVWWYKK